MPTIEDHTQAVLNAHTKALKVLTDLLEKEGDPVEQRRIAAIIFRTRPTTRDEKSALAHPAPAARSASAGRASPPAAQASVPGDTASDPRDRYAHVLPQDLLRGLDFTDPSIRHSLDFMRDAHALGIFTPATPADALAAVAGTASPSP